MFHLLARNPERTFYNGKGRLIQPFRHCPPKATVDILGHGAGERSCGCYVCY